MIATPKTTSLPTLKQVDAGALNVGYAEAGPAGGSPVLLLHGWPYAEAPSIAVPTITLEGDANGAPHLDPALYADKFLGNYEHRTIGGGVGHNLPHEAPQAFVDAIVDVDGF